MCNYIVMAKNAVDLIVVVCYNANFCKYYINNGGQKMTTYEKVIDLLMEIVPELAIDINYYLERKMSFFISVNDKKISEISIDQEFNEEKLRQEKLSLLNKNIKIENSSFCSHEDAKNIIINKFFKR